jgi:hypothetical protein
VGFVVDEMALGHFIPSTSIFPSQFHSSGAPLHGKAKKLITIVTGWHSKPQGCGPPVASASEPSAIKKAHRIGHILRRNCLLKDVTEGKIEERV